MTTSQEHGFGLWDAFENLRTEFGKRVGPRMGRGDVRTAILSLLTDGPMHGYQIIQEIEKRSSGAWKPSAGSVYPTLQLLADEGLIQAKEAAGRKTYTLTAAGTEQATATGTAPWEGIGHRETPRGMLLPKAGVKLAEAAGQIARSGTPEQVESAVAIINEARRKLYTILAQE
ncbi:DNA-binding PadR family transcriptional regulator [Cryobacterium mesophilum]|uniref:PadR family transcriptional regulator n=1 Tax=Terrimesophilobacter mesophilus TaxID=433647 RepID=A0A4R8V706_9MICO|nr:PadR family transcriptional regulator [Terrimesophilobacter mesophilus]MBB5631987.1 DNA-binding PadR family transcriptional regulator [Terrimesophilobacter mesophilus]TFB78884.1 PadR family transcriptional regulator [Terrimesophilobacter mesophilus]